MKFFIVLLCLAACVAASFSSVDCVYMCDDPICKAICVPECKPAQCEIQCQGTTNPLLACKAAKCWTSCPQPGNATDSCPMCETRCDPASCTTTDVCSPLCQAPQCNWKCYMPTCRKPICQLQCEKPACEALPSSADKIVSNLLVVAVSFLFARSSV